ncbi:putative armadillo-like helical protein [Helianthus anomalus]
MNKDTIISLLVKSLKNPRSAVCKTGIMTCADMFKAFGDKIIEFLDPLLAQLLLKSSQDKRFVCDAAEKALVALTTWVSPVDAGPSVEERAILYLEAQDRVTKGASLKWL